MLLSVLLAVSFALPAAEFAKYHREITGRDPAPDAVTFAIDPKVSVSGTDAYTIRSVEVTNLQPNRADSSKRKAQSCLITGSNMRSVWYGLYDLLERRGGCRWFWDGDKVPKRDALDLAGLDVREEARFEYRAIRYFAHRGLARFQAEHWGPADWEREIDWLLKRRLNCFMPRIGMDDTWQKAFPDIVPYPDPTKGDALKLRGYDNRAPFWPLEFRGKLRKHFTDYAFRRGLMIPTDFGTMSHWYSRTPAEFLEKAKPPYLPQSNGNYNEPSGLVWDIFKPGWLGNYWRLTEAFVGAGYGTTELMHTIGLGERRCFADRAKNLQMKKDVLSKLMALAKEKTPDAKILIAGWDFYLTWGPEEVRELIATLDPASTIIWDYEAEAYKGHDHWVPDLDNNFTKWNVVGRFPYTFGIFLAFEQGLDIRADYPTIEAREKVVANDPMCKGYIFWPESSHTDTLLLRYFTANAWKPGQGVDALLPVFCRDRYGDAAAAFEKAWRAVLPISQLWGWGGNCVADVSAWSPLSVKAKYPRAESPELAAVPEVLDVIAALPTDDEFRRRDALDLARTVWDRELVKRRLAMVKAFDDWIAGKGDAACVEAALKSWEAGWREFAALLARHPDYSLADSMRRLDAVEKVRNPDFYKVLLDNALNTYCRSHQYEGVKGWILPLVAETAADVRTRLAKGVRQPLEKKAQIQRSRRLITNFINY